MGDVLELTAREKLDLRQRKRAVFFARQRANKTNMPTVPYNSGALSVEDWAEELGSGLLAGLAAPRQTVERVESVYGISEGEVEHRLQAQDGRCAICQRKISRGGGGLRAVVDHDHAAESLGTMHVRGILCASCNHAEGNYRSSVESHLRGALYLLRTSYEQDQGKEWLKDELEAMIARLGGV